MFAIFSLLLVSDTSYDLTQPFKMTGLTDIGDWSVVGAAATIKKYIRLTSAVTDSVGGLCHRKPTQFENWTVDFDLRAFHGNGGAGINFTFTKQFCPTNNEDTDGFTLYINTTTRYSLSNIYLFEGNRSNPKKYTPNLNLEPEHIGSFDVRGEEPIKIRITREGSHISIKFIRGFYITNFDKELVGLPTTGYFSINAFTTNWADDNDILEFRVAPLSEINPVDVANISQINKAILDLSKQSRRVRKLARKFQMIMTSKYIRNRRLNEETLTGFQQEFNDVVHIIRELTNRAGETVREEDLKEFILNDVETTLSKAASKIALQMDRFKETEFDMNDIWGTLKGNLRDLAMESQMEMKTLGEDAIQLAKKILNEEFIPNEQAAELADEIPNEKSIIPLVLILFCICEFIVYIMWFNHKRVRTSNFKKFD